MTRLRKMMLEEFRRRNFSEHTIRRYIRTVEDFAHRVAISNHRLVSFTNGKVTFRWRDSAHQTEQKLMTLPIDEFLRASCCTRSPKVSCASATSVF